MRMQNNGYFSAKRDREIINNGGFPCRACLVGKLPSQQSPDPRYCQGCYDLLLKEAEMDTNRHRCDWKPIRPDDKPEIELQKHAHVVQGVRTNMSTLESEIITVDIIQPPVAIRAVNTRGPKHKPLPLKLIKQWADEGKGSKAIATCLRKQGIKCLYPQI